MAPAVMVVPGFWLFRKESLRTIFLFLALALKVKSMALFTSLPQIPKMQLCWLLMCPHHAYRVTRY